MNTLQLQFGDVREKKIRTLNDFISHMIEHIAWRMGLQIELVWENEDWRALGVFVGRKIRTFTLLQPQAATVGMIDDGSAEVAIDAQSNGVTFTSSGAVDKDWFLSCRCEQIERGQSLMALMEGLSEGLEAGIAVTVANLEDQHHTWEGVFRSIGITLSKMYTPREMRSQAREQLVQDKESEKECVQSEISVLERSANSAQVRRGTAETGVTVSVDFLKRKSTTVRIDVADSIRDAVNNLEALLLPFADAAGFSMEVDFKSKILSASHVVTEDIGLALGRALLEILKVRMQKYGMNGAGSNVQTMKDLKDNIVNVGVSVEGRKFWRFVPFNGNYVQIKKDFLIGKNVLGALRSEDLDDFIDGLAGGLSASIMVHVKDYSDPNTAWQNVFLALGRALREVFDVNPYRKGVPPGVRATLS